MHIYFHRVTVPFSFLVFFDRELFTVSEFKFVNTRYMILKIILIITYINLFYMKYDTEILVLF